MDIDIRTLIERSKKMVAINNQDEKVIFLILEHIIKKPISYILANMDEIISEKKLEEFSELLGEYIVDEKPVAYILGYTYFFDCKINVNEHVLIPRPETEQLVEIAVNLLKPYKNLAIADIGTGSGNIAIALQKNLNDSKLHAIDISGEAIKIAEANAIENGVYNINFTKSSLLDYFIENEIKLDVIISNPPYIKEDYDLDKSVKNFEPHGALFGGIHGIDFYEEILKQSKSVLNEKGFIVFEMGFDQKESLTNLINKYYPKANFQILPDYAKKDRFVIIEVNNK